MRIFKNYHNVPEDFSGVCKVIDGYSNAICYYKNGKIHREDGPAIIKEYGEKRWFLNGLSHRESGAAIIYKNANIYWLYKDKIYGEDHHFTNESWMQYIQQLKRKESLKIFI